MKSINVRHKYAGGWHVFFSEELPGLYVASQDYKIALDDVGPAITKLIELNDTDAGTVGA